MVVIMADDVKHIVEREAKWQSVGVMLVHSCR